MKIVGLFAGIGGLERGFHSAGFECIHLCELNEQAQRVLQNGFDAPIHGDIATMSQLPDCDVITAGFPCQDLSMAGMKAGIEGSRSNVVSHLFRLLDEAGNHRPEFVVIENVAYMLKLQQGSAMKYLVEKLERLGYRWAYRTVDARSFGVPQRRHRVILVAARSVDPSEILFADESGICPTDDGLADVDSDAWYGFYWTEGKRGIGWAKNSVPPVKGGSGVGIPSPPAIWQPKNDFVGTIDIRDAERLQGFPADWTEVADGDSRKANTSRWRLVGNAVCVPKIEWLADRIKNPGSLVVNGVEMRQGQKWPWAASGSKGSVNQIDASLWPVDRNFVPIEKFLKYPLKPLSRRATAGYLKRLSESTCRVPNQFFRGIETHLNLMNSIEEKRKLA